MAGNTAICNGRRETVPKKTTTATAAEITEANCGSRNTAAPCSPSLSKSDWLIEMALQSKKNLDKLGAKRSLIQHVPDSLRKNEKHEKMFDPLVVSIGPYHRGKPQLLAMEDHKKVAAAEFAKSNMKALYDKVFAIVGECRECYDDRVLPEMNDEEFSLMLFFDGCFILQFIVKFVGSEQTDFTVSTHLHGFILQDMFLLENQLPYLVLEKLMEVKSVEIDKFLDQVAGTSSQRRKTEKESISKGIDGPHRHLLARLRMWQLGPADQTQQLAWGSSWQSFRSAKELIESGIKLRRGESSFLRHVKFTRRLICGELSLPQIVVDDLTRSRLLNMIALEMCNTTDGDYGITSFVWLLDLLIDSADDVKELRKATVLLNALGSDEQAAELFNEIATDLVPDQHAYSSVMSNINEYYGSTVRVSIYRMLHTHFGSPWTAIAFLAAFVLLALTVVQTVFSVIQTHYTIHPPSK